MLLLKDVEQLNAIFFSSPDHNSNDSHQTFGNEDHLTTYKLDQSGRDELARLLSVLAHTRPEISYCPLLHPMASLLLHYMDAERAFDCLSALLGSRNYKYLDQSWVEFEAYRRSFTKLAKKFAVRCEQIFVILLELQFLFILLRYHLCHLRHWTLLIFKDQSSHLCISTLMHLNVCIYNVK